MGATTVKLDMGGSEFGFHATESFIFCPRKYRLDSESREGAPKVITGAFGIGTLFHAFMDLYYRDEISNEQTAREVVFEGAEIDPEARAEAQRLVVEYMARFSNRELGKVIATELQLPRSAKEAKVVQEAVGKAPWTGRLDLVVDINQKTADSLKIGRYIDPVPGIYIVDHKTESAKRGSLADEHRNNLQLTGYMLAWNAANPKKPCKGAIVNIVVKTKVPQFLSVKVPFPNDSEIAALHERYRVERVMREALFDVPLASTKTCFGFGGICQHYLTGACNRGPSNVIRIGRVG